MGLSRKQQVFVEEYLACWNATQAALKAGYSQKTARQQGSRLLTNVDIAEEIRLRVAEKTMSADEVLVRLAEEATGSMGDFMDVPDEGMPAWNFQKAAERGKLHLIRKVKTKTVTTVRTQRDGTEEQITEVEVNLELYNAQTAKELIGKHHKLFTDKVDVHHSGSVDFTADEAAQAEQELDAWNRQKAEE